MVMKYDERGLGIEYRIHELCCEEVITGTVIPFCSNVIIQEVNKHARPRVEEKEKNFLCT